jgi:hypothetical protein
MLKSGRWLLLSQHGLNVGWKNSSPPTQIIIDTNMLNLRTNIMSNNKSFKISFKIIISNLITLFRVHKRKSNSAIQINQIKTLKN